VPANLRVACFFLFSVLRKGGGGKKKEKEGVRAGKKKKKKREEEWLLKHVRRDRPLAGLFCTYCIPCSIAIRADKDKKKKRKRKRDGMKGGREKRGKGGGILASTLQRTGCQMYETTDLLFSSPPSPKLRPVHSLAGEREGRGKRKEKEEKKKKKFLPRGKGREEGEKN